MKIPVILASMILCSGVVLAVIAPTTGTFDGLYRRDRWGDGTLAYFKVSPNLQKELEPFDGRFVRIWVRKAIQHVNPGPATLYKIWTVREAPEPKTNLRLVAHLVPDSPESSAAFSIDITFTNTGAESVIVTSEGARIRITGEARDPMEIQQHWCSLWGGYESYPSHAGMMLISTSGNLNQKDGVTRCPTGGTMHDSPLAPGASFTLSLPMKLGLPSGRYELAVEGISYPPGADRKTVFSRTWLPFDIQDKTANQPSDGIGTNAPNHQR